MRVSLNKTISDNLAASSESMQRVTTVVSGRSVKCNAIFAVWMFAVVDLFSRVYTSHFQHLGTPCLGTNNKHSQHCFVR